MTNYVQIIADGTTTVFNANFELLLEIDIFVYITPPGQVFDEGSQLVSGYTVSILSSSSFTITFITPPINLATVTIWRRTQDSFDTQFYLPQAIKGSVLDATFHRIELVIADLQSDTAENIQNGLHYPYFESVSETLKIMPIPSSAGQLWMFDGTKFILISISDFPVGELALIEAQIQVFIQSAGITFNVLDPTQIKNSVGNYQATGSYYQDAGIANEYIPTRRGGQNFAEPTTLIHGVTIDFVPLYGNTENCTVTFLGETKPLKMPITGLDVPAGFIKGAHDVYEPIYTISYSGDNDFWVIINASNSVSTPLDLLAFEAALAGNEVTEDGANLVGYYNTHTLTKETVKQALDTLFASAAFSPWSLVYAGTYISSGGTTLYSEVVPGVLTTDRVDVQCHNIIPTGGIGAVTVADGFQFQLQANDPASTPYFWKIWRKN